MQTRSASAVADYYSSVKGGDYTLPTPQVQQYISGKIDTAANNALTDVSTTLKNSREHRSRVMEIQRQPRTAGASSVTKAILRNATPFEQYSALKTWQEETAINKTHTFVFANPKDPDDYIPVSVKANSAMQIMLGSTKGERKAPKYAEWAQNDPRLTDSQKRFIAPLESLEMVRQPEFSGATLLKSGAFANDHIDSEWRYGKDHACVESKGQGKNTAKKLASAGVNLTELFNRFPDSDSDNNLVTRAVYEDYVDVGYNDDAQVIVTPHSLFKATRKSILTKDDTDLNNLVSILFMTHIGPQNTPAVQAKIERKLF